MTGKKITRKRVPVTNEAVAKMARDFIAVAEFDPNYTVIKKRHDLATIWSMEQAETRGKTAETWLWIDQIARSRLKTGRYLQLSVDYRPDLSLSEARAKLRKFVHRHSSDIDARMKELQES